jgi:hypothetical protein
LKKIQSRPRFIENQGMSKITSPRNFKIGGDEPDYDKFEPFCTVIDNREIMLNRRIKATYC